MGGKLFEQELLDKELLEKKLLEKEFLEKEFLSVLQSRTTIVVRSDFTCGVGMDIDLFTDNGLRDKNYVLSWILLGEGNYRENGNTYPLGNACVCMRRPGRDYVMELNRHGGLRLFLTIPMDIYPALCRLIPELDDFPPVWKMPIARGDPRGDTRKEIEAFCTLYDHMEQVSSLEIYKLLPEMIQYILRLTGIQQAREKDPLSLAKSILAENWSLSLGAIAERCGMNYNTFRKQFTETYGVSPGQYRIQQRILEGSKLIADGMSVTRAATRLGYPDVYSFTHQFTAVMGMPPAQYAARHR